MSTTASLALIALLVARTIPSGAQDVATPDSTRRPPENVALGTFAAAGAMIAFTALFDPSVARAASKSQSSDLIRIGNEVDRFGEMSVIAPVLIGTAAVGFLARRPELLRLSVRTAGAIAFVSVGVQAMKFATGRDRPYQDEDFDADDFAPLSRSGTSFPSGHTAAAFAMATTLGDAIGNRYAQGGFYVLAAGTGWARIALLKHWPSDVIAGAALGILAGKLSAGKVKLFGFAAPKAIVTPDAVVLQYTAPLPRIR